jgi:hypothetical protein
MTKDRFAEGQLTKDFWILRHEDFKTLAEVR